MKTKHDGSHNGGTSNVAAGRRKAVGDTDGEFEIKHELSHLRKSLNRKTITTDEITRMAKVLLGNIDRGREFVLSWLNKAREDSSYRPPARSFQKSIGSELVLFEHKKLRVSINVYDINLLAKRALNVEKPMAIVFSGRLAVFRFLNSESCRLGIWECAASEKATDNNYECWKLKSKSIDDGSTLVLDGSHESFVIDSVASSVVVLQAVILTKSVSKVREFDSSTGKQLSQSNQSLKSSRIQMYSTLLRLFKRIDAYSVLEKYLAHEDSHVRWHVMRELTALDTLASLKPLKRMSFSDSDVLLREVAGKTLQMVQNEVMI